MGNSFSMLNMFCCPWPCAKDSNAFIRDEAALDDHWRWCESCRSLAAAAGSTPEDKLTPEEFRLLLVDEIDLEEEEYRRAKAAESADMEIKGFGKIEAINGGDLDVEEVRKTTVAIDAKQKR